jgi:predicted nucleic acid-binding protein
MIVVDASVLYVLVAEDDEEARRLRGQLVHEALSAPHLIDVEVVSALRREHRAGRIGTERAMHALADLPRLPLRRVTHTHLLARAWALRDNLSAYDATYVALAERLRAPLLTADARLARAPGIRCDVQLVT